MYNTTRLRSALDSYTNKDRSKVIPEDYYERMLIAWKGMNEYGQKWDPYKAAAALLFAAHMDGFIHEGQINSE